MIISTTKLIQHQREIEGIQAKFACQICFWNTGCFRKCLGKSSTIQVCLSEFCLSHDVTCALCCCKLIDVMNILGRGQKDFFSNHCIHLQFVLWKWKVVMCKITQKTFQCHPPPTKESRACRVVILIHLSNCF